MSSAVSDVLQRMFSTTKNFECFCFKLNRYFMILTWCFKLQITCIGFLHAGFRWKNESIHYTLKLNHTFENSYKINFEKHRNSPDPPHPPNWKRKNKPPKMKPSNINPPGSQYLGTSLFFTMRSFLLSF